jgi:LacI family transcriptional regulator
LTTAPRRRPVMMDVATLAGVSQTTVSLVLNDVPDIRISDAARRRVRDAAATLGYRIGPRGAGRLRVLGFLSDELSTTPFAAISADSARDAALEENAMLMIAVTRGDPAVEASVLDLWRQQDIAGIIYARIFTRRVSIPPMLRHIPSVLLNCYDPASQLAAVVPAEQRGGLTATRHLVAAGHRRIAMINGEPWMEAARDRAAGYRRALREAGLAVDAALYRIGDWEAASGRAETLALMALADPPTAIFCGNDLMAQGCYDALKERGLSIPGDVSVVGFDNRPIAPFMDPPLTTLELPHAEMGRWASSALLSRRHEATTPMRLECTLIARQSVAPPVSSRGGSRSRANGAAADGRSRS